MAKLTLEGAAELRARLNAIQTIFEPVAADWADDATRYMRQKIHSPKGHMRESLHGFYSEQSGEVWGDWHVTFIDKGRQAFTDEVKSKKVLTRGYAPGGRAGAPVFGRRARVGAVRKRPFIRSSANKALRENPMAKECIKAWNEAGRGQRGVRGERYVLGNKANAKKRAAARRARTA